MCQLGRLLWDRQEKGLGACAHGRSISFSLLSCIQVPIKYLPILLVVAGKAENARDESATVAASGGSLEMMGLPRRVLTNESVMAFWQ